MSAADTSSIIREELLAPGPGRTIYGYVTAPVNYRDTKLPTIIFSHGFSGRAESGDAWAHQLAGHGYVVYSFDFMGATEQSRSGNDVLAMSPFTEKDDLDAVLTMIRGQQFVDTQNIFLMGQSQGGVVSTMVAAERNDDIAGLILLYPAYVLFDDARTLFSSVDQIPPTYTHRGKEIGRVYFEHALDFDPYAQMSSVTKPVLLMHGTADRVVPISYAERAARTFPDVHFERIDGAGHKFNSAQIDQSVRFIEQYLSEHVKVADS